MSSKQSFEFKVETKGMRFDQFLAFQFPAVSLTRLRKVIREGEAKVNGRTTIRHGWILQAGDLINVQVDTDEPTSAKPENLPLEILFEDDDLIIINKPVGMLSHPSHIEKSGTVMNALAWHFLHSKPSGMTAPRPILLHRLDRDTSGVLAIAKNERANIIVSKAFRLRRVSKSYIALVHGVVEANEVEIDAPLGRNPTTWPRWCVKEGGDASQTKLIVKERFKDCTLVTLEPLTGRTHQLRIHCTHIGHPIIGDQVYRGTNSNDEIAGMKFKHQLLHAEMLKFFHPSRSEEITFRAPLPVVMEELKKRLRNV